MDAVDRRLLAELQADARLSYNELSRRVSLSAPAVAERVRRLEADGVITGYHAHVDLTRSGLPITALVQIQCYGPRCVLRDPEVPGWPEVLQLHRVTGGPAASCWSRCRRWPTSRRSPTASAPTGSRRVR